MTIKCSRSSKVWASQLSSIVWQQVNDWEDRMGCCWPPVHSQNLLGYLGSLWPSEMPGMLHTRAETCRLAWCKTPLFYATQIGRSVSGHLGGQWNGDLWRAGWHWLELLLQGARAQCLAVWSHSRQMVQNVPDVCLPRMVAAWSLESTQENYRFNTETVR